MRLKKAQMGLEFLMILAIVMFVFLYVFSIINQRSLAAANMQERLDAKYIANKVSYGINQVSLSRDGASLRINLADEIVRGGSYNISVFSSGRVVDVRWKDKHFSGILITSNVEEKQINKSVLIKNEKGKIVFQD